MRFFFLLIKSALNTESLRTQVARNILTLLCTQVDPRFCFEWKKELWKSL